MPVKSQGKWLSEDIISNVQVNWENTYKLPFLCTVETKLRVFQFKFIHRRIATNDFLHKRKFIHQFIARIHIPVYSLST